MYGSQYRYGIEVVDENNLYQTAAIVNDLFEITLLDFEAYRLVVYVQNGKGIYLRERKIIVDLEDMSKTEKMIQLSNLIKSF